ncbi:MULTISPECIES: TIGR02530 family flagellar biosynthesis protein [unclassified Butyrivibrio]|uniref:TIGR02530 family flagellar biosynthesis protein n=1 Tax=unclassified Butyrivibrio TaxID=2639466 RepID=UPI0003B35F3F|nr:MULTISPECIES: TIGR02530 family flagellar biosynthesis protein [unclassified Butyrivibrio]SDB39470.1 flagellar operon protein [Butyrivibrio sp. INlla16]SEK44805.1 flagellar operon protein [Butyrivibrio sp. ob235]
MRIDNTSGFLSIEQVQNQYFGQGEKIRGGAGVQNSDFGKILSQIEESREGVRFSKHASNRLSDRNIELTQDQMNRLNNARNQANAKGINESLILVDQLAFIVNVKSNTVVTAMDSQETGSNIFTNIDGAVIA